MSFFCDLINKRLQLQYYVNTEFRNIHSYNCINPTNNVVYKYYMSQIPKYGTFHRVISVENVTAIVYYIYRK